MEAKFKAINNSVPVQVQIHDEKLKEKSNVGQSKTSDDLVDEIRAKQADNTIANPPKWQMQCKMLDHRLKVILILQQRVVSVLGTGPFGRPIHLSTHPDR